MTGESLQLVEQAVQQTAGRHVVTVESEEASFKSKRKSRKSATFTRSAFSWRDGKLPLAKTEQPLDIVWSRPLPEGSQPSSITVSLDTAGRWFVSILTDDVLEHHTPTNAAVGIDTGIAHLATLSTGEKIDNPKTLSKHARQLARAQRALSRKQQGSKNRSRAQHKMELSPS